SLLPLVFQNRNTGSRYASNAACEEDYLGMTSQHESDALSAHGRLEYHTTVGDLPTHEQPRERLQHAGPQALSAAELLAIALRTGTRRDNALELAGKLLARYGGLSGLVRADFGALCSEYGMGKA